MDYAFAGLTPGHSWVKHERRPIERRPALFERTSLWRPMLSLKELSAILLIGTIAGVATIPAAFCQQTKDAQAQSTGGTQVLPPGGLTLAGPAT